MSTSHSVPAKPRRIRFLAAFTAIAAAAVASILIMRNTSHTSIPSSARETSLPDAAVAHLLASKRIFFAHRSVGTDILGGVESLVAQGMPAISIHELDRASPTAPLGITHVKIGQNSAPLTKISDFENILVQGGLGHQCDVALLKFCFVDINQDTDIDGMLKAYADAVARIRAACPSLIIVHATVPLRVHDEGLRSRLRNWLKGNRNNLARSRYNQRLVETFGKDAVVCDIARTESTRPDGTRESYDASGTTYYALCPAFSEDGGHLNIQGARIAAVEFMASLNTALKAH